MNGTPAHSDEACWQNDDAIGKRTELGDVGKRMVIINILVSQSKNVHRLPASLTAGNRHKEYGFIQFFFTLLLLFVVVVVCLLATTATTTTTYK